MSIVFWLLVFLIGGLVLAYHRVSLRTSTFTYGVALLLYALFGNGGLIWMIALWAVLALLILLNVGALRMRFISRPFLRVYRRMLPSMSQTEKDALEAGTVWWDGELFSGGPDWEKLLSATPPRLSAEEQAFIDGPCEELCRMIDDWDITHRRADLPPHLWDYVKSKGFFAMIIPKKYGGLEFSAYAHSCVLVKLSSRSSVVASTVAVPNSLGPAELLLHYGTEEQRSHYLPRLARGEEVPCFALTGPRAGSDAASIPDTGVVCRGMYEGREVVGLKLNFSKRYITLAPVATVVGLAFKLFGPGSTARWRPYGLRHHLRLDSAEHAGPHDRSPPLSAQHSVPERTDPGEGCLRAARLHHRRAEDGRPGLAHARRTIVGGPLHFLALERHRRFEGSGFRYRRLCAHPPAIQRPGRTLRGSRRGACAHDWLCVHHGRWPLGYCRSHRRWRETLGPVRDAQVSPDRPRTHRRSRCDGYSRRQGNLPRTSQLPCARLSRACRSRSRWRARTS